MSMILKSYEEGKLALEDWTDDMLTTLPGWSGWQHCNYNCAIYWDDIKIDQVFDPPYTPNVSAGDVVIDWSPNYGGQFQRRILASDARKLPLIAGKPFVKMDDGYYYIRGNSIKVNNSYLTQYDIARCTSIPGA